MRKKERSRVKRLRGRAPIHLVTKAYRNRKKYNRKLKHKNEKEGNN